MDDKQSTADKIIANSNKTLEDFLKKRGYKPPKVRQLHQRFWGYVLKHGYVSVKPYVNKHVLKYALTDNTDFIIKPFIAKDIEDARRKVKAILEKTLTLSHNYWPEEENASNGS